MSIKKINRLLSKLALVNSFIILSVFSGILLSGCATNDGQIGNSIADPGISGVITDTTFYPNVVDDYYYFQSNTSGSQSLFLGAYSGFEAKFLIKFSYFPGLPDSFTLDSAWIKLTAGSYFGDTLATYPDFNYSVNELTSLSPNDDWFASSVTWDSVNTWNPVPIFESTISQSADTDSIEFTVPNEIVENWLLAEQEPDTSDTSAVEVINYGLIFNFDSDPQFAREFFSAQNADTLIKPQLFITITTDDSLWLDSTGVDSTGGDTTLTMTVYCNNDVFITRDDTLALDPQFNYIGRGIAYRSLYYIDMEQYLPVFGNSIHRAEFTLFVDSDNPLAVGEIVSCQGYQLADTSWFDDPFEASLTGAAGLSSAISGDSLVVDITSMMESWVPMPETNFGFAVKFSNENYTMARLPVYPADYADFTKRPYLRLIYSGGN